MTDMQGVIILSAALKRRLKLADKAKSMFISKYGFRGIPGVLVT